MSSVVELVAVLDQHSRLLLGSTAPLYDQITWCAHLSDAVRRIETATPHTIVVDTSVAPDAEETICTVAARRPWRPLVLLTTDDVGRVPRAIKLGCDSVLLKPFPRNLLIARLSRLRHTDPTTRGTNVVCPTVRCTRCGASGAVNVDAAAYRRCWFVCLVCDHVWLAKDPAWAIDAKTIAADAWRVGTSQVA